MYCHTISPGSLISWYKGAAPPPSHYLFTSSPPPLHISPLRVILCTICLWPHFPCYSNSLFVPISQRGCGFWRQCSKFNLQGDFSIFLWDNAELFFDTFSERWLASLHWFSCFVFVDKSKTVESADMTVWIVCISQTFAESSQFCKHKF